MILGLLALAIVVIRAFPKTPTAHWLNAALVEQPLEWLSNLKRRDIILFFVMAGLFLTAGEFVAIFGMGELLALGVNLSFYVDAVLVTGAATVAATVASGWRGLRARFASLRRPRRARARRAARKPARPKSPDDDAAPAWDTAYA